MRRQARVARPADDAAGDRKLIDDEQVTAASGVPTIWLGILQLDPPPTSDRQHVLCGSSAVPELIRAFDERFDAPIIQGWG
jgi:fatty-acyl-CoA synthase